jgi:hypothetical protein
MKRQEVHFKGALLFYFVANRSFMMWSLLLAANLYGDF